MDQLFAELTGLHFHIAWLPAGHPRGDAQILPTGCLVCCRLSGLPLLPSCRICGPKQTARILAANGQCLHFVCLLGVRNFWMPVRIRGETLGIAYLQALEPATAGSAPWHGSARKMRARLHRAGTRVLSRVKFARASHFLRHIVQHVQTASLADLRKADLATAAHAMVSLEQELERLHGALQRHLPPASAARRHAGPESHAEQIVHRLVDRLEEDYRHPVTLRQYARTLGMNAAYLSDVFSRTLGIPFKTYLVELRLDKAKQLLSEPASTVSEVAFAVGYASETRFRTAFKKATGLSPKLWREIMQVNPPRTLQRTR
ncbi:MAG: helix-turn-helix domain-containing protein [Verrucomicrobia bacterium]|nr:helix-turn-helix domain-containing protein [Verrucomicrobiota bacterium]